MERGGTDIAWENYEQKPEIRVTLITQGLGFGEGEISGNAESPDVLKVVDETISHNPEILVPIDRDESGAVIDDDGCGDGRWVKRVFNKVKEFARSLNRPKIFGGAPAMSMASRIGLGKAAGEQLNTVFDEAIDDLDKQGMNYGGHTDESCRHSDCNCGCGAIDKAPESIKASTKYKQNIIEAISALGVDTKDIDKVYGEFEQYAAELDEQPEYSGRQVMDRILGATKVVKELGGKHHECRIVLNMVKGYTVNQGLIRQKTNGRAQIFAVDVWRLKDIAADLNKEQPETQKKAFLSELIYTMGVAAVLTKGDLPVYVIEKQTEPALATA